MREVKRDFPWFSITEYEKEAAYISKISTHRVEILQYLNYFLNLYFPFP